MKLEEIEIRDFRGIEHLRLSFKDDFGLIRDRIPIVGPNTSGKTSILNAIALALAPLTELAPLRGGLRLSPASIVRHGAIRAYVKCVVWFSDQELKALAKLANEIGRAVYAHRPDTNRVTVEWSYPDADNGKPISRPMPYAGWLFFQGRKDVLAHLHVPGVTSRALQQFGGVYLVDQWRTALGMKLSPDEQAFVGELQKPAAVDGSNGVAPNGSTGRSEAGSEDSTITPRTILTSLAVRAQFPQHPEATEQEVYSRLCDLYARVCHPHKIIGPVNTAHGLDMEFSGEHGEHYFFDGLSSGQQMILLLLLQFAERRIHRSIVLIDELELHLHPLWQGRLYQALTELGEDNQILFTTHSTHLRDTMRDDVVHCTGELEAMISR